PSTPLFQSATPMRIPQDDGSSMSGSARPVGAESPQATEGAPKMGAGSLLLATKQILEMIAAGASLTDILTNLEAFLYLVFSRRHAVKPRALPKGPFALCRCGGSTNKPLCDGTHTKVAFKAAEAAVGGSQDKPTR